MLQSLKQLCGRKLGASDGEIGKVKDFYFDDQNWTIRYVVVDTGTWLTTRQVLLPPHVLPSLYQDGIIMLVNLTRKQIEESPSIETHKPVSRQFEEAYHRHYGWPTYWEYAGLPDGQSGLPILQSPSPTAPTGHPAPFDVKHKRSDTHLRSAQAVNGYRLMASDGTSGHLCDFMLDDQSWVIRQLVINVGNRFAGKEVVVSVNLVDAISYEESTVLVRLSIEAVGQSSEHRSPLTAAVTLAGPAN
ncbi:MAG: PRC-barrel domain-containing protein [Verrucomicrobiota bacterium]